MTNCVKTELGFLPKEWEIVRLGEIAEISSGGTPSKENENYWKNGTIKWLGSSVCKNLNYIDEITNYITQEGLNHSSAKIFKNGTTLIALVGATIGKVAFLNFEASTNQNIAGIYPKNTAKLDCLFLFYSCLMLYREFKKLSSDKFKMANLSFVKSLKIHLPPLKEQKKIAEILSLWDSGILTLERLILKKQNLKKGLMQRLLKADKFSKWKEFCLGEICKIKTGSLNANAMVKNGKFAFFTCAKEVFLIDKFAFDTEALLISGNGAHVGYIHYYKGKFNAYQRTYVLDEFSCDIMFVKFFLDKYLKKRIAQEKNEGNTPYIVISTLQDMKIFLPPLKEQKKIAEILNTQDKEISLLQEKLKLLKTQKKALMQQILNAKIRVKI